MQNYRIEIKEEELFLPAKKMFREICGFDSKNPLHQKMEQAGLLLRAQQYAGRDILASVSFFSDFSLEGESLFLEGTQIRCSLFAEIPPERMNGVLVFLLTAGDGGAWENPMETLYADIWGTAYTQAAVDALREILEREFGTLEQNAEQAAPFLSQIFGPGYFGMPVSEMKTLHQLAEGSKIGISVTEASLLVPQKSCAGLFLLLKSSIEDAPPACENCVGQPGGCRFCKINRSE